MAPPMDGKAWTLRRLLLACALLWVVPGQAQQLSPRQWADQGNVALSKGEHRAAAVAFDRAVAGGFRNASVYAELAAAHMALGDQDAAVAALAEATTAGLRMTGELHSALAPLHGHPRWPQIVAASDANLRAYRASHGDPEAFRFVSSDIDLFWSVVDRLPGAPDPALLLEREYLDKGTAGLHGFIFRRIDSGAKLHAALTRYPRYYAAARPHSLQAIRVEGEVRAAMRSFKGLYDKALFPDVYFVIGAMSSGGTASMDGLIIGTEVFSRAPDVPVDELSPGWRAGTKAASYLPSLVVHELMHFQQDNEGNSLLAAAIKEGAADFLASLLVKGNFNEHVYAYGYANEAQLKREFAMVMDGAAFDGWLYSAGKVEGRPNDLGYFMGFRICQAYYNRAQDKRRAIADILNIKDARRFLADSGYL